MNVYPAIDVCEGACVQLLGGAFQDERIRIPDPADAARRWLAAGFRRLHLVDLDAASGRGSNRRILETLLRLPGEFQVGGGVREESDIAHWLQAGAVRVVVGTRAIEDRNWLDRMAFRFPGRLVVAADNRGRQVVTRGWTRTLSQDVGTLVASLDVLPLAGVLVTAVNREGRMNGTDLALVDELVHSVRHPVQASGGIASLDELSALARAGAKAAILGMALYTSHLDAETVAREFA